MNVAAARTVVADTLGLPGVVGIGLLLFSLAFWLGTVAPARAELEKLDAEKTRLAAAASSSFVGRAPVSPALPSIVQLPDFLKKLNTLAAGHGLVVQRTLYQIKGKDSLRRLEIELPLKASYPALRAFLRDALAMSPGASLDDANLQRAQAAEPAVDAQLRLSFGFAAP